MIGSFPGKPSFAGLGELAAAELETLWPSRDSATTAVLRPPAAPGPRSASEPAALADVATHESTELPFLGPALRRLLEELPAPGDGLSRDGKARPRGDRRRSAHPSRRLRCRTAARTGALSRRHVVLSRTLGARQGETGSSRRRGHATSRASAARRRPDLHPPRAARDGVRGRGRCGARPTAWGSSVSTAGSAGPTSPPSNAWRWDAAGLKLVPPATVS